MVYQSVETTSQISSESGTESDELYSEETEDNINSHCLNVAIEYYLTSAKKKEEVSRSSESKITQNYDWLIRHFSSKKSLKSNFMV